MRFSSRLFLKKFTRTYVVFLPIPGLARRRLKKSRRSSSRYDEICARIFTGSVCNLSAGFFAAGAAPFEYVLASFR